MSVRRAFCLLSLVVLHLSCGSPAMSQEESDAAKSDESIREQTIYIPYEKLRETFEREGRGVFLPYERFQELWKAARQQPSRPAPADPPVKAMITGVENEAVVEKDVVRVVATVKIDVLGEGWIEVPLRLSDVALLSAQIDGLPARVLTGQDGAKKLLLQKEAKGAEQAELRLEYAKSITKAPGQNSVTFQPPQAAVNAWKIRIPESGAKVTVHPMLAATEVPVGRGETEPAEGGDEADGERPESNPDETVILAFVGAAPSVRIEWNPKAEGARGLDALVSVRTEQEVTIDEGITRTETRLAYEIRRAELSQLTIRLPADQRVVNVVDANVRQWDVEAKGDVQLVTVGLFQPARSQQTVVVESEKFTDQSADALARAPVVQAVDAGRQLGMIVVRLGEGLRAEAVGRTALSQLDTREIPDSLSSQPWAFSFRYASLPFELSLRVEKIKPQIRVDQLVEVFLQPERLSVDLLAKYDIQRAGVFELELDVPEGYEVRQVRGHAAAGAKAVSVDSHLLEGENQTRLKVNLSNKAIGSVGLLVRLEKRLQDVNLLSPTGEASPLTITPPRVAPGTTQRATGRLVVYAPESLRIGVQELTGLRSISVEEAYQDTASVREGRFPEMKSVQSLAFSEPRATAVLTVQRRLPQVIVRQLLVVQVEPGVVKYQSTFFYDIRYSSVKQLRIDIPADLAARVRNETTALREETIDPSPSDLAEGYVAWSLTGETELIGSAQCKLTWETPIEQLAIGNRVDLTVPRLVPSQVDRAEGQIVLVKAETIDIQPKGQPEGLDPIDPQRDLMPNASVPDAAVALQFHDQWQLTLTATRYELETLKHTSIERAVLRMVITRSDRVSVQALYRMRSNRQRLEIQLPDNVATEQIELDTDPLRINGRRVTLERGGDDKTFFVPLVGFDTDAPFLLELRYTAPGSGQSLTYPMFPDEPAVQTVSLVAYIPREWSHIGSRGPWTHETQWTPNRLFEYSPRPRENVKELINKLTEGIGVSSDPVTDFPTDGRPLLFSTLRPPDPSRGALQLTTIDGRWLRAILFLVFGLGGVLLLRWSAFGRIAVTCGVAATLLLVGAFLPTLAYALLTNYIILAMVLVGLLWLAVFAARVLPKLAQLPWPSKRPTPTEPAKSDEGTPAAPATPEETLNPPVASSGQPSPPPSDSAPSDKPSGEEGGPSNA